MNYKLQPSLESQYRSLLENYVSKGAEQINEFIENDRFKELASWQRSVEFFHLNINKKTLIKKKLGIIILPPDALNLMSLSFIKKNLFCVIFILSIFLISLKRIIKTYKSILSIPTKYNSEPTVDGLIFLKLDNKSLDFKYASKYQIGPWLAENYFKRNLSSINLFGFDKQHIVQTCSYYLKLKILLLTTYNLFLGCLSLLLFRWQTLYTIDDYMLMLLIKNTKKEYIPKNYFFCFQGTHYRPIWTWEAEKKGVKIIQFHNSSSLEPSIDGKYHDGTYMCLSTWPEIIPFNKAFAPIIKSRLNFNSFVYNTPTIQIFDDKLDEMDKLKPLIGIFDITPIKKEAHIGFSHNVEYFNHMHMSKQKYYEDFYLNCIEAVERVNGILITKPKKVSQKTDTFYLELLNKLELTGKLKIISSEVSPYKVMDHCMMCIVQPFTSPCYYNDYTGELCVYDPANILPKNHENLLGRRLIHDKHELSSWVFSNFTNNLEAN